MSMEEPQRATSATADTDEPMQSPTTPVQATAGGRRPRLNLDALGIGGGGERKRGKSMFGVLVNTLNKAKAEDKERSASEAAKKRQLIEQRLQSKLKKETDHVRQTEEAKRDKVTANRKEEDLQLKDSVDKHRRTHIPILSNFLLTSDVIPPAESDVDSDFKFSSLLPPRSHPPPLYYLPAILTPEQESFLSKRKQQAKEAAEKDWEQFKTERAASIEEITTIRRKVSTVLSTQSKTDEQENGGNVDRPPSSAEEKRTDADGGSRDAEMEVDDSAKENGSRGSQTETDKDKDKEGRTEQVDGDDAVEY